MPRYRQVLDEHGEAAVVRIKGVPSFVYAKESCKECNGRGLVGMIEGCPECLGTGKKDGAECVSCRGTGKHPDELKYHIPCTCLKHEQEMLHAV
jgi:RecJ-like exonuclease